MQHHKGNIAMPDSHASRPAKPLRRRDLFKSTLAGAACLALPFPALSIPRPAPRINIRRRIEGMLIGTLIGDAAGGPVEFKSPAEVKGLLSDTRDWPDDRMLDAREISRLARSLPLLSYEKLRPRPEPYAQWTEHAAAGTITDDSRQKLILINTLRYARSHYTGTKNAYLLDLHEDLLIHY